MKQCLTQKTSRQICTSKRRNRDLECGIVLRRYRIPGLFFYINGFDLTLTIYLYLRYLIKKSSWERLNYSGRIPLSQSVFVWTLTFIKLLLYYVMDYKQLRLVYLYQLISWVFVDSRNFYTIQQIFGGRLEDMYLG